METLIDIGMAIGPVLGYVHQYYIISKNKSVGSFSIDICGILLFANILRLNFYVFTKYATALLWQSINMILVQICLVYACTKWRNKKPQHDTSNQTNEKQQIGTENISNFWRWHQFTTYLLFILLFTFVSFSITFTFKQFDFQPYGVFVGLTALLSQSILILPQIIRNYKKKCTQGLSFLLVGLNLFGDIFKLVYFIIKVQAFQFIVCGVIQVILDSFVIFQIYFYRKNKLVQQKDHKSLEQKNEYNFDDVIKTDTQKNFDDIEMMENAVQKQSSTDDTDQNYESQRPSHIKQKEGQVFVYTKEWGMKFIPTDEKKQPSSHFQEHLNTIPEEKCQDNQLNVEDNKNILQQKRENIQKNMNLHPKKANSEQNNAVFASSQFFQANYVLPPKSMQNVKVQS